MKEIRALTSLRGIFALWVLAYHFVMLAPVPIHDPSGLAAKGYLGVDFFFLLSGFILAMNYGNQFKNNFSFGSFGRFLVRRAGRLFPLHLTIIIVCVAVAWLAGKPYSPTQVFEEAALVQRWPYVHSIFASINGPSWTISTEWLAYILFPIFIFLTLCNKISIAFITGAIAAISLIWLGSAHGGSLDLTRANTPFPLIRCLAEFAIGMIIYRCRDRLKASAIPLMISVTTFFGSLYFALPDAIIVGLMIPILLMAGNSTQPLDRLLGVSLFHNLGLLSFSIYLVQLPVLIGVRTFFSNNNTFIFIGFLSIILTSVLTYNYIEVLGCSCSKRYANILFPLSPAINKT
jgi:peptidoglycan/LPS O-acetylase OafA/YrhL